MSEITSGSSPKPTAPELPPRSSVSAGSAESTQLINSVAKSDETDDTKHTHASDFGDINAIADMIEDSAKLATQVKDYISYSTILSIHLDDPTVYTEKERQILINRLLKVLENNDELVYNIGWDLPELLLGYFLSSFNFTDGKLRDTSFAKPLSSIFTILAEKGNSKEVNLKALDLLAHLTVEDNYDSIWNKTTRENDEYDGDISFYHTDALNLSHEDYLYRKTVAERYLDLKFNALFELISTTLSKVSTSYPSRFLASATSGLLSFLANNINELSAHGSIFVARRLYLFPRDYQFETPTEGKAPVSEVEHSIQIKLLQSFITFLCQLMFTKTSPKWAQRLFIELRFGVAAETDQLKRERHYVLRGNEASIEDLSSRIEQQAYSFDLDIVSLFNDTVKEYVFKYNKRTGSNNNNVEEDQVSESSTIRPDVPPFDFQGAKAPDNVYLSKEGIFLLATRQRFANRKPNNLPEFASFGDLIKLTSEMVMGGDSDLSSGVIDALCFWALWMLRNIKTHEQFYQQVSDEKQVIEYLQCLTLLANNVVNDSQLSQLIYSVINRILSLQSSSFRCNYLIDTIESCPFSTAIEVAIKSLKDFLVPPASFTPTSDKTSSNDNKNDAKSSESSAVDSVADSVAKMDITKSSNTTSGPNSFNPKLAVVPNQQQHSETENAANPRPVSKLSEAQNAKITRLINSVLNSAFSAVESQQRQIAANATDTSTSNDNAADNDNSSSAQIDFGLLTVWANFLTVSPLTPGSMKALGGSYNNLVARMKDLYNSEKEDGEDNTDNDMFLRQIELLEILVKHIV